MLIIKFLLITQIMLTEKMDWIRLRTIRVNSMTTYPKWIERYPPLVLLERMHWAVDPIPNKTMTKVPTKSFVYINENFCLLLVLPRHSAKNFLNKMFPGVFFSVIFQFHSLIQLWTSATDTFNWLCIVYVLSLHNYICNKLSTK